MFTKDKVVLFLSTTVVGRPSQKNALKTVGKATVDQYVTALTDLWKMQSGAKLNNHPTPREPSVCAIQKQMGRTTDTRRRESYEDRGRMYQHLLNKEMGEDRKKVSEYFWNAKIPYTGLRNRMGYLLCEQRLLRGETVRDAEIPDFFLS